jgi:hypothetical protein
VGFDRPAGHVELPGNLSVVTPLKQQLDDLLLSGSQLLTTLFHALTPGNLTSDWFTYTHQY